MSILITTDATTFRAKVEAKIDAEIAVHSQAVCLGSPGITDHAAYRFEVGYITALMLAKEMLSEVVKESSEQRRDV